MTKKAAAARRQRNQELARIDALNRCYVCKRNLREHPTVFTSMTAPGRFCSEACIAEWQDARDAKGAV